MTGGLEHDLFLGSLAEEYRGLLNIRYPMEHGIVKDWADMEKIWQHVYSKNQLNSNPEEVSVPAAKEDLFLKFNLFICQHPVLLTEAPLNPRRNREKAAEIFFETFSVPALYISMQAVLSL